MTEIKHTHFSSLLFAMVKKIKQGSTEKLSLDYFERVKQPDFCITHKACDAQVNSEVFLACIMLQYIIMYTLSKMKSVGVCIK